MRRTVTAFSNPTVKAIRALRDKKQRRLSGRFLAEGLRLLTDAREAGRLPETLLMAMGREPHPLLSALEQAVVASGGEVIEVPADLLGKITGKDNPQAVAGVFAQFDSDLERLDAAAAPLWLAAHAMRDPGNLGTMLRTADAVGAGGVVLIDDCADPFSVESVRASMGAIFTVKVAQAPWPAFHTWLRRGQAQLVAASLRDAVPYRDASYAAPCFVLVGNESRGLPQAYEDACDLKVTIPMLGRADSLNAAVAAAVLAYEALAHLTGGGRVSRRR
jgi:TrmH family RNA methyltransferase